MKNKGFTLIEVIIVVVVISILIAVAIPAFNNNRKQMRSAKNVVHVENVAPAPALTEECVGGFAFIRGEGTLIQKLGSDGLPASC